MELTRKFLGLLVLVVLATAFPTASSVSAQSLSGLTQDLNRKTREINNVQQNLRRTKQAEQNTAESLLTAQNRLEVTQRSLDDIVFQLRQTRERLEATRAELAIIEERLKERNDLLAGRLADTYKHGSVSYLSVLLGAADFWDLITRGYVLRRVLNSDVELIDAINADKQLVEEHKAMLEEQEQARVELENRHRVLVDSHRAQAEAYERMLEGIRDDRVQQEQALTALQQESNRIEAMIRQMQSTPEGRRMAAQTWSGRFIRPVPGRISSGYGMRRHPILGGQRMHTGIDYAAPHGTTIVAAANGYVSFAGRRGGYGNTVIIEHGGNVSSLYAHCSTLLVRAGAQVRQGQAIARVGSTGLSTGPHLHFEVRRNGRHVDPFQHGLQR